MNYCGLSLLLRLPTLFLTSTLLTLSVSANAVVDFVESYSSEELASGFYLLMTSIVLLLIIAASQLFLARRHKHKLLQAQTQFQQTLDNLPTGIVHLNLYGNVIYVNKSGATMLGREANKVLNRAFSDNFNEADAQQIKAAQEAKKNRVSVRAKSSNLHIAIQLGETRNDAEHAYTVITLNNQDNAQRELLKSKQKHTYLTHLIQSSDLAQVHINTEDDSYIHDRIFDRFVNAGEVKGDEQYSPPTKITHLINRIHNHDMAEWTQAFNDAARNKIAKVSVRLKLTTTKSSELAYRLFDIDIIGSSAHINEHQEQEKPLQHTSFTLLIRADDRIEIQKRKIDVLNHQREAILKASPHATYAIDKNGLLLWSNARFDDLLRRIAPDAKSSNLFEINPFPENIMSLHKNSPFMTAQRESRAFELTAGDGSPIHLKLELAFYITHDRLSAKENLGVVGFIQNVSEHIKAVNVAQESKTRTLSAEKALNKEQARLAKSQTELTETQLRLSQNQAALAQSQDHLTDLTQALEKEQQRMTTMLDLAPVAIATINQDEQIVSANKAMLERLKYTEKELKKGNIYKLFSEPAEAGTTAKQLNKKGKLQDFHVKLKGKDGKIYPGELKVDLVNHDTNEYLFWIVDRSDEQFQHDKFESLLQHSNTAYGILSEKGFCKLNDAACNLFGIEDEEELFGKSPSSIELNSSPSSAKIQTNAIARVSQTGGVETLQWEYKVGAQAKVCRATYVAMHKDHAFDSILCIWETQRSEVSAKQAEHSPEHAKSLGVSQLQNDEEIASIIEQAQHKQSVISKKQHKTKQASSNDKITESVALQTEGNEALATKSPKATYARIAKISMPDNPSLWFDLPTYLVSQKTPSPKAVMLSKLIDKLSEQIQGMENSLQENLYADIEKNSAALAKIAKQIQSEPLSLLIEGVEDDCRQGMIENVSIRWPATKSGINNTLRVVYSHLDD
jgi:epidermal growth factor receptor substrate 15